MAGFLDGLNAEQRRAVIAGQLVPCLAALGLVLDGREVVLLIPEPRLLEVLVRQHRLIRVPVDAERQKDVVEAFPGLVEGISVAKPSLEDVFIQRTGHRFWTDSPSNAKEQA